MTQFLISVSQDSEWQKAVIDKDLSIPPPFSSKGDRYIVDISPSGEWAGREGDIAWYDGSHWQFIEKLEGMLVYVKDEKQYYFYKDSWNSYPLIFSSSVEIDFGEIPKSEGIFVINDPNVKNSSVIVGNVNYVAPDGKELDELEMDAIDLKFAPGDGRLTIWAKGLEGYLEGKFKINYIVG